MVKIKRRVRVIPSLISMGLAFLLAFLGTAAPTRAEPHESRLALKDGKIRLADLYTTLGRELHLKHLVRMPTPQGEVDIRAFGSGGLLDALSSTLGGACKIARAPSGGPVDTLLLTVDPDRLPAGCDRGGAVVRFFSAVVAPDACAAQRRGWGLLPPAMIDESKPLVILVHGLDTPRDCWWSMAQLLEKQGYATALFGYPGDGHVVDAASLFAQNMEELRAAHPNLRVSILTHSMGSLVARAYLEGPEYKGGVDHFIMLGPPNHGSPWARLAFVIHWQYHYRLWRDDPDYQCSWMDTDGGGAAGKDLRTDSPALTDLNKLPRRDGVKYTIVAGNQSAPWRYSADIVEAPADWVPTRAQNWWGFRHVRWGLQAAAGKLRRHTGDSDGPVPVESAKLEGVEDFVVVPADHVAIYAGTGGRPPAAWETVRDRLGK